MRLQRLDDKVYWLVRGGVIVGILATSFGLLYLVQCTLLGPPTFASARLYSLFIVLLVCGSQFLVLTQAGDWGEILRVESVSVGLAACFVILGGMTNAFSLLVKPLTRSNLVEQADVIIVLGGSGVEKEMNYAVHLYNLGYAKEIYSMTSFPLGYLEIYGPAGQVIHSLFPPPVDTYAEALLAKAYMTAYRYRKALLVTRPFHMQRAGMTFQKQGIEVCHAPVPGWYNVATDDFGVRFSKRFLMRHYWLREAIREYIAIVYYWLRGRL